MTRISRLSQIFGGAIMQSRRMAVATLQRVRRGPHALQRALVDLVLPLIYAGCEKDLESNDGVPLCLACRRALSHSAEAICPRCAAPAPAAAIHAGGCLRCQETSFRFKQIASLGVYQGLLQTFVLRMKHPSGEALALAAGRLLGQRIRDQHWIDKPDVIAPAPMHWLGRIWRGINAPATIAEAVAKELGLPTIPDLLRAVRRAPRQATLTPSRRRHNMRGAFAANSSYDIEGRHVLVIDDVLTTGATANALARPLLQSGACIVSLGVVARGIGVA